MYNVASDGEVVPFGDDEHKIFRVASTNSTLNFQSLRYQDPATRWWIELLPRECVEPDRLGVLHRLLLPDTLSPSPPRDWPQDRVLRGVADPFFPAQAGIQPGAAMDSRLRGSD